MPRDIAATFTRAVAPYVANLKILAASVNAEMADIALALTGSLARDGSGGMLGNLSMGSNRITGVGAPSADDNGARRRDLASEYVGTTNISGAPVYVEIVIPPDHPVYEVEGINVTPAADSFLLTQFSYDNGLTYKTGGTDYVLEHFGIGGGAFTSAAPASGASLLTTYSQYSSSVLPLEFKARIIMPTTGAGYARLHSGFSGLSPGSGSGMVGVAGGYTTFAGRPNKMRMAWNLTQWANQGTLTLRGIRP